MEDIDVFKHTVDQSIQKARDVLSTHRGWSELLHALASALVSACSLGIANAMTNTGFFGFFKVKTDSERMLDQLESTLNAGAVN